MASILKTYIDWQVFTQRNTPTFLLTPKQTPSHSTTHACFIFLSFIFSTLLRSTPSSFPSTMCSYLSLHLSPSQSSPAKGWCPFIIHGVVLMAQAAMSDVNLCVSKARSGYTTSSRKATAQATVLRNQTRLNQQVQSYLGHTAHGNSVFV